VSLNVEKLKILHKQVQADLNFINQRTAYYYNAHHEKEPNLKKGDRVYLLRRNITTKWPNEKLNFKKLRPFIILERKNWLNYKIKLPEGSQIYDTFHISLLEPAPKNVRISPASEQLLLAEPDDTNEKDYEVQKILELKYKDGQLQYRVRWKGCQPDEDTWEPTEYVNNITHLIKAFHWSNPDTPQ